jgi:hypothetical protein
MTGCGSIIYEPTSFLSQFHAYLDSLTAGETPTVEKR